VFVAQIAWRERDKCLVSARNGVLSSRYIPRLDQSTFTLPRAGHCDMGEGKRWDREGSREGLGLESGVLVLGPSWSW